MSLATENRSCGVLKGSGERKESAQIKSGSQREVGNLGNKETKTST